MNLDSGVKLLTPGLPDEQLYENGQEMVDNRTTNMGTN